MLFERWPGDRKRKRIGRSYEGGKIREVGK